MRDYFAAKALAGFCANPAVFASNDRRGWGLVNASESELAEYAYHVSDFMLAAREEKGTP